MLFSHLLPNALQLLLSTHIWPEHRPLPDVQDHQLTFELRHIYVATESGRNVFSDVHPAIRAANTAANETYTVSTRPLKTSRLRSGTGNRVDEEASIEWDDRELLGPRVDRRHALYQLAKMTFNAFYDGPDGHPEWYELDPDWKKHYPFGWEPPSAGLRGQIFVSPDNTTILISIKGTSAPWLVGGEGGPTQVSDKLNNNLLFSCCCARVGPSWTPVCGCYDGGGGWTGGGGGNPYRCDENCVERALVKEENLFYPLGINLYNNVSFMYPDATIWLTGHSLGGSVASLVGLTFGAPAVTFAAPGDRLAARRLHLPSPPSTQHITQIYHTADPVPVGACTGIFSACAIGGYAIESRCHLGTTIKYDTVQKKGWSVSIRNHPIQVMIDYILNDEEWTFEDGREVPYPEVEQDCFDCTEWEFGDYGRC